MMGSSMNKKKNRRKNKVVVAQSQLVVSNVMTKARVTKKRGGGKRRRVKEKTKVTRYYPYFSVERKPGKNESGEEEAVKAVTVGEANKYLVAFEGSSGFHTTNDGSHIHPQKLLLQLEIQKMTDALKITPDDCGLLKKLKLLKDTLSDVSKPGSRCMLDALNNLLRCCQSKCWGKHICFVSIYTVD